MKTEIVKTGLIFLLAFLTGVNFVVFPALGTAFTDPSVFALSSSQFGSLFLPQVVCIIISCLSAPFLVNRFGPKVILAAGIALMILSTGVLWSLQFFMQDKSLLFPVLMVLVAFTGSGFGLSITTLNPLAASLFKDNPSSAILILQFLVGLGTSASPLMMSIAGDVHHWMYVPGIIVIAVGCSFIAFLFISLPKEKFFELPAQLRIPPKLWLFFGLIVLYGFIEGTFGSFGTIILKGRGLSNSEASLGLSLFWGGIAVNRLLFGIFARKNDLSLIYLLSPIGVGAGIVLLLLLLSGSGWMLSLMFLTGFFMGSIFPGTIGWGTVEFPTLTVMVSGFLMAANQVGTGIVTNVLGHFASRTSFILYGLAILSALICICLFLLKKNSKIKEAF
ncbi:MULTISPECIES: MFS transporter [Chryseobacterium]|uniref:FHS family glucose/mannose:H+ symporter-like MFS transporter n=1 Tax=Chryseobacterium camelliae TaxID=1265445 RepID=A0ABU0TF58_9FLAO|nr:MULTISPECIES: MFS transporter [Chryseobacterium]MDT3406505.1 FHS family glucose/mannose:H+ symporter-like MFS transporter [Pseudacidovorax intermedius]MDQ1095697.1 FHS family glucose/mannose:H+ symporter-like MFS transporter [Chryseobacterium camelliae]MDQ1099633.1 FHS family glucose/mannose:H+ symporter-like MFS transporter [Chryseobacterium sp. SORGH_AS_1048]MDR6086982.1 FHS family glucose/mannose:H+ symporter-like MFS transporter [Chryseobacterium sp. SORGH_AS_0909]MDR6131354.1 FHS famil